MSCFLKSSRDFSRRDMRAATTQAWSTSQRMTPTITMRQNVRQGFGVDLTPG